MHTYLFRVLDKIDDLYYGTHPKSNKRVEALQKSTFDEPKLKMNWSWRYKTHKRKYDGFCQRVMDMWKDMYSQI